MRIYIKKIQITREKLLELSDELYGGLHADKGIGSTDFHYGFVESEDTYNVNFEILGTEKQIAFIKLVGQSFEIVKIEPAEDGEEYEEEAIHWWQNTQKHSREKKDEIEREKKDELELEVLIRQERERLSEAAKDLRVIDTPDEIAVNHKSIKAVRIGFVDQAFNRVLGSGEQYDRVVWGAYRSLNPDLADAIMAEPKDGSYHRGYQYLVAVFLKDSIADVFEDMISRARHEFKRRDVIVQQGSYYGYSLVIATILECDAERSEIVIEAKQGTLVLVTRVTSDTTSGVKPAAPSITQPRDVKLAIPPIAQPISSGFKPVVKTNTLALTSLILGILTIFFGGIILIIGVLPGIAALVTGYIGRNQIKESKDTQKGEKMALAGMILGGVGLIISIVATVLLVLAILAEQMS